MRHTKNFSRRLSRASQAYTMIELLLAITVISALSVTVLVGAWRSGQTREAIAQGESAVAFGNAIESAWTTNVDYSTLTTLSAAPFAPTAFKTNSGQGSSGSTIQGAYGAVVAGSTATYHYTGINGVVTPPSFALQFNSVPSSVCPTFAGSAAPAYDNVIINGNASYAKTQGGNFNPTLAVQQCNNSSGNTVTFTRMRTYPVGTSGFCLISTSLHPQPYSPTNLTDPMWQFIDAAHFKNTMDGTTYITNPPQYDRLFAPDGTLVC